MQIIVQQTVSSLSVQVNVTDLCTVCNPQFSESEPAPAMGTPYKWKKKSNLLDYDNNGYT